MKLVKSLLLGSAAGLMAVTGSMAADLPSRKAAPAEYVRICSAYGAGFFFIPGTETCLRVGGRVRAEYLVTTRATGERNDAYGFRARGFINLDARNQTAYGTLRTFVRLQMTTDQGQYRGGANFDAINNTAASLDKAFIQFAGITAGRAQSFFDYFAFGNSFGYVTGTDGANVNLLAYTASFGGGFSATLSLEDGSTRRHSQVNGTLGREYPDVVGVLRLDQSWGSAQVMGAIHQVRGAAGGGLLGYDKTGYAIGAGATFNVLPTTSIMGEFVYAKGALDYLTGNAGSLTSGRIGGIGVVAADSYVANNVVGIPNVQLGEGYSIALQLAHRWTPTVRQNVFGGWQQLKFNGVQHADVAFTAGSITGNTREMTRYAIGTNVIWSPVAGLDLGVEVLYTHLEASAFRPAGVVFPVATTGKVKEDAWRFAARIQRDF